MEKRLMVVGGCQEINRAQGQEVKFVTINE